MRLVLLNDLFINQVTKHLSLTRCFIFVSLKLRSKSIKDDMPVSFRSEVITSYILTIFKQRNLLP